MKLVLKNISMIIKKMWNTINKVKKEKKILDILKQNE